MTPNTRIATFGLKKEALSLTSGHNCKKCKLRSADAPTYRASPKPRKNDDEKIIVILTDHAFGASSCLNDEELKLINASTKDLKVDRVEVLPSVFCKHNKEPTKLMLKSCETRLIEHLNTIKPNVVVCLGKGPAAVFNVTGKIDKIKMGVFEIRGLPTVGGNNPKLIVTNNLTKVIEDYSLRSQLANDLAKAVRICDQRELTVPQHYYLLEEPEELLRWLGKVKASGKDWIVAADIETNGRSALLGGRMRTISFCWAFGHSYCVPFELNPEAWLAALREVFACKQIKLIWHNACFDIAFLKTVYDLFSEFNFADTMLDAYLLEPGKGKYGYGLKGLSLQHTDLGAYETDLDEADEYEDDEDLDAEEEEEEPLTPLAGAEDLNKWERIPLEKLATYNCCDTSRHWCQ